MIQVTSYNVLADMYASPFLFPFCAKKDLEFQTRSHLIIKQIRDLTSDIVCLQEVDHFHDFYRTELEGLGYQCIFSPKANKEEGLLTLVKKDTFVIESQNVINFDQALPQRFNNHHFKKNGCCQLTQLIHIATDTKIIVGNTHIFWNPYYEEIKILQTSAILQVFNKLLPQENVILCGDFNSTPFSNVYHYLTVLPEPSIEKIGLIFKDKVNLKNQQDIYNLLHGTTKMLLKSAYDNYEQSGSHPEFTNYTQKFKGNLDYIFFNQEMKGLQLKEVFKIPISEIKKEKCLPNSKHPSDHVPITALFSITDLQNQEKTNQLQTESQLKHSEETTLSIENDYSHEISKQQTSYMTLSGTSKQEIQSPSPQIIDNK